MENTLIENLKRNFFSTAFGIGNKDLGASVGLGALIMSGLVLLFYLLASTQILNFFETLIDNPEALVGMSPEEFVGGAVIVMIILWLLYQFANAAFMQFILDRKANVIIGAAKANDLDRGTYASRMLQLFIQYVVLAVFYWVLTVVFGLLLGNVDNTANNGGDPVGSLFSLVYGVFAMKLILAPAFVSYQGANAFEALQKSWQAISFLKAAKYFFIAVLVGLGLGILFVVFMMMVAALIGETLFQGFENGGVGSIVLSLMMLGAFAGAVWGYIASMTASISASLYFRSFYEDEDEDTIYDTLVV